MVYYRLFGEEKTKQIAILGGARQAGVVIDIVEKAGEYGIAGLIDISQPKGAQILGYSILGDDGDFPRLAGDLALGGWIIAIGDNWRRFQVWQRIRELVGDRLPMCTAIHPSAQIGRDVSIGEGTVLMAGAVVNSGARIGAGCIVNTNSSVDHDCHLDDFSSAGPGVTIGGSVRVGKCSALALGANVIHGMTIGEHTVVGAGATVVRSLPDRVVAYGTPARIIRKRAPGDQYL